MTVPVNSPWPSGTENYSSAQAQTHHLHLHRAKPAQSISPDASLHRIHSAHRKARSPQNSPHTTLLCETRPLWVAHRQYSPSIHLPEPCPTAASLQLHKLSISFFLSVQLMCPVLSTLPYHSHSQTGPRSHLQCLCFQRALTLHEVSKSITHSHSAHLRQRCRHNSLLLSCRLAETDPFRANIHQLVPGSPLAGMHRHQNPAAGVQLFMARASPEPLGSLFYHSCQKSACPTHAAWPQAFTAFSTPGTRYSNWVSPGQLLASLIAWKTHQLFSTSDRGSTFKAKANGSHRMLPPRGKRWAAGDGRMADHGLQQRCWLHPIHHQELLMSLAGMYCVFRREGGMGVQDGQRGRVMRSTLQYVGAY